MSTLIIAAQFVLSLSLLIVLHECGHFFPARWFRTRVEKFYLFFDPWFSLFKIKRGDTEYGIGWLPLGGYVKIAGMIDESMDKEALRQPPQPWEFRSKPAWQRLIIMLGGVTVNFVLGLLIFWLLLAVYGERYLPNSAVRNGLAPDSIGLRLGLQAGDLITAVGNKQLDEFSPREVIRQVAIYDAPQLTVLRNGEQVQLPVPPDAAAQLATGRAAVFTPRIPFVIAAVLPESPASRAGLLRGDSLVAINGDTLLFFDAFQQAISAHAGKPITVAVMRNGEPVVLEATPNASGKLGVQPYGAERYFSYERRHYGLFEALPRGIGNGVGFLKDQVSAFGQMFRGKIKASESVGGFVSIAKLFPDAWDWESFWRITASLSLILAFMNLLPIPALDGGHVVFLLIEIVTRRKVSEKVLEYAQLVGFVLLLSLLLYANGADIYRLLR